MALPLEQGAKVGTWADNEVMENEPEKYNNNINKNPGESRWGGMAEKMGNKIGVPLPGFRRDGAVTTPYLGRTDRMSQAWLNRWTILLLLALARALMSTAGVKDNIDDAKEKIISLCLNVEEAATTIASMPHYMSSGINEMTAAGIEGTINGVVTVTTMLITGVEQLIIFVIGLWKSTWMCLISALVQGAFDLAAAVAQGAADLAKKATEGIADVLQGAEKTFGDFSSAINKIPLIPDIPDLKLGSAIDTLKNLNINATDAIGSIADIKSKVPTYEELENKTAEIISIPFNLLKGKIEEKWSDFKFDRDILPVAAKDEVLVCSNDARIPAFFQDLANTLDNMRTAFIAFVIIAAIAAILFYCWQEYRRWSLAERTIDLANGKAHDLFDAAWIVENPYLARFSFWSAHRLSSDPDKQLLVRWAICYGTSPPALFVLSLAFSSLITCVLQLVTLNILKTELPKLAAGIGGVAAGVVNALDSTSANWANDTNSALGTFQADLNDDMFGHIKEATGAVNDALTTFTDGINDGLKTAFGNTPFMDALKVVVDCVLLNKVEKVQKGLTWAEEHAHISFPTLANDTFSLKKLASNSSDAQAFLDDPQAATNAQIGQAIGKIIEKLKSSITSEMLVAMVLVLVYVIVVLLGISRAVWGASRGINASQPEGDHLGGASASDAVAAVPPVDVDENGQHWVEHDGVQYMIDPAGQYVVGEDGDYITRKPSGLGDDDTGFSDSESDEPEHDNGHGRITHSTRSRNQTDAGAHAAEGGDPFDDYARHEKHALDDHYDDHNSRNGMAGLHDVPDEDPFDDRYGSAPPPSYPATSYRPPYADEGGRF